MKRILYAWITLVLLFLAMVLGAISIGRAATTSSAKQHNSIGVTPYQDNPYGYLVVDKIIDVNNIEGNLNIRVHPIWTYMLFDQNFLICGLPLDKFEGISAPFAITYEKQAHRMVEGVACHNVVKVDSVVINTGEIK